MSHTAAILQTSLLGQILLRRGQVRKYQLEFLLKLQQTMTKLMKPISIGELLIKHRAVSQLALTEALAVQESMPKESVTEIVKGFENTPYSTDSYWATINPCEIFTVDESVHNNGQYSPLFQRRAISTRAISLPRSTPG